MQEVTKFGVIIASHSHSLHGDCSIGPDNKGRWDAPAPEARRDIALYPENRKIERFSLNILACFIPILVNGN